jgi:hypothetical protein
MAVLARRQAENAADDRDSARHPEMAEGTGGDWKGLEMQRL